MTNSVTRRSGRRGRRGRGWGRPDGSTRGAPRSRRRSTPPCTVGEAAATREAEPRAAGEYTRSHAQPASSVRGAGCGGALTAIARRSRRARLDACGKIAGPPVGSRRREQRPRGAAWTLVAASLARRPRRPRRRRPATHRARAPRTRTAAGAASHCCSARTSAKAARATAATSAPPKQRRGVEPRTASTARRTHRSDQAGEARHGASRARPLPRTSSGTTELPSAISTPSVAA